MNNLPESTGLRLTRGEIYEDASECKVNVHINCHRMKPRVHSEKERSSNVSNDAECLSFIKITRFINSP